MNQLETINKLVSLVETECCNPDDYEGFIDQLELFSFRRMAKHYQQTPEQMMYILKRVRVRLSV